jgi:hypothetical protein
VLSLETEKATSANGVARIELRPLTDAQQHDALFQQTTSATSTRSGWRRPCEALARKGRRGQKRDRNVDALPASARRLRPRNTTSKVHVRRHDDLTTHERGR